MKKRIVLILSMLLGIGAFGVYQVFLSPTTSFSGKQRFLYIHTYEPTRQSVLASLEKDSLVKNTGAFDWMAKQLGYWQKLKPGKYKIEQGMNLIQVLKTIFRRPQTPSKLVINKLRISEDFARLLGKCIESDSAQIIAFLNNKDSLKNNGLGESDWHTYIIPDTYEVLWTWPIARIFEKLKENHDRFWNNNDRLQKAAALKLSPVQIHTLASIVEEETNVPGDKPLIASVYLNRLRIGMPLQADPTIRFALKDFKMNRVMFGHLRTPSPYNTYLNRGLPPGPICTPSKATIDSVLNAPKTDYIFFVANADLQGGSTFTTNLTDHNRAAKVYQDSLNAWLKRKANREQ